MNTNQLSAYIKRRWLDFRNGHSTYLVFMMGFSNFILIAYNFIPSVKNSLDLIGFGIIFISLYIPLAIIVGRLHLQTQVPTEIRTLQTYNPQLYEAVPGKDKLFSLPAAIISNDVQLKAMEMHNAMVDSLNDMGTGIHDVAKALNIDIKIRRMPKWDQQYFEIIEEIKIVNQRLVNGENIHEILRTMKSKYLPIH